MKEKCLIGLYSFIRKPVLREVPMTDTQVFKGSLEEFNFDEINTLLEKWQSLAPSEHLETFFALARTQAEELFLRLTAKDQAEILLEIPKAERRSWIRLLAPDDAADLVQSLPEDDRQEVINLIDPKTKAEVIALMAYAEDKAGGLMNSRFVRLRPNMTVEEAIRYMRAQTMEEVETIYTAYVLDNSQKLMGVVSLRLLFSSPPTKRIDEIMIKDNQVMSVTDDLDQEAIARVFSNTDLTVLPVLDSEGRMKGIITLDDVVQVVQEEATEDIQKYGGMEALDAPYFKISFLSMVKKRAGWLLALFIGEMFTATAMGHYENEIEKAVVLAVFLPLIISSGGNSGSQASTLIIRAMALGEVKISDWWRVFFREVSSGLALGLILGAVGLFRIMLWSHLSWANYGEHFFLIGTTVACSLIGIVLWGTLSGSMLPFVLRSMGFDPAAASAPFVATLVDVTGLIIYFTVASLILHGTLL
jgi:magnesium transporter